MLNEARHDAGCLYRRQLDFAGIARLDAQTPDVEAQPARCGSGAVSRGCQSTGKAFAPIFPPLEHRSNTPCTTWFLSDRRALSLRRSHLTLRPIGVNAAAKLRWHRAIN